MSTYSLLVFLHVLGGVGIFVSLGIEALALPRLRGAVTRTEAGTWLGMLAWPRRIGSVSMLAMLATGIVMMLDAWGPQPWIQTALITVVLAGVTGGVITGRGMRRIGAAFAGETEERLSPAFRSALAGAALTVSLRLRLAAAVGILGLMTIKPALAGSVVIMAAAITVGLLTCLPLVLNRLAGMDGVEARR